MLPLVLSPGFEPGPDSSLDCRLYRLGHESMRRQSARICPRSPLWIRPLVPNPAPMPAVDAHTATRGMTGITGAEPPCSTETVPTACGSADRIRADPTDGGLFASATHRLMGAGDIRVSVEQTGMRGIVGHDPHGHDCPAGNSQRAWNRIERCTGIEPASSVWKTEALTIVLTPQTGIRTPYQKQIP